MSTDFALIGDELAAEGRHAQAARAYDFALRALLDELRAALAAFRAARARV